MNYRDAFRAAVKAARENLLPGLLLQSLLVVFLAAYVAHEGTRTFLMYVASIKQEAGYVFSFLSYVLCAAVLPEALRVAFFQNGRIVRKNWWSLITSAPFWGCFGMLVDLFYRCQEYWLGAGENVATAVAKMAVDQFIVSPFLFVPLMVIYFAWRDDRYRWHGVKRILNRSFFPERVMPVQIAGWLIWIPGTLLVYAMPAPLQIPVAVMIQAFWVLVFTIVNASRGPEQPHMRS